MLNEQKIAALVSIKEKDPATWKQIEGYCITNMRTVDEHEYDGKQFPSWYVTKEDYCIGLLEKINEIVLLADHLDFWEIFSDSDMNMGCYNEVLSIVARYSENLKFIIG